MNPFHRSKANGGIAIFEPHERMSTYTSALGHLFLAQAGKDSCCTQQTNGIIDCHI
ncbi:hypothetical protein FHS21_003763 [Phyllobacterium trifolii]|uniref:Uncharacterized protein n=1 Tax=Phyllobacterium trifolii TaxID=300193 RepID=A0A839UBV2_9HYPH|nr:hypothetical protein [Phyllobacterium trifolii]